MVRRHHTLAVRLVSMRYMYVRQFVRCVCVHSTNSRWNVSIQCRVVGFPFPFPCPTSCYDKTVLLFIFVTLCFSPPAPIPPYFPPRPFPCAAFSSVVFACRVLRYVPTVVLDAGIQPSLSTGVFDGYFSTVVLNGHFFNGPCFRRSLFFNDHFFFTVVLVATPRRRRRLRRASSADGGRVPARRS